MSTRRRLSQLLLASHMGLLLLFAALLLATGVGTIRTAVLAQARAEAERSVSESRRRLQEWSRELRVAANLLAEQPTLPFYLRRNQLTKARALVADFHRTSGVDYIRVQQRGRTVAEIGQAPPDFDPGLVFDSRGQAWRVVQRGIPYQPQATLVMAARLGDRLASLPGNERVTLQLRPLVGGGAELQHPLARAWQRVSKSGEPETMSAFRGAAAARVIRIRDEAGDPSALLTALVEQAWVERRIFEWLGNFGLTGLVTGVLALALAVLLAARISRPFAQLARDAERLGRGDLDTPVPKPRTFLSEPVALATSLEQMRSQVATLTATEHSQREELEAVLDGVDEGIVGVDEEQRIHYANRQFLELVGRSREDVLGEPVDSLMPPPRAVEASEETMPGTATLERRSVAGSQRPLILRRLDASGGRQVWVVREENAIEAARAMRDRILANLSHEFQTPLSAQIASIELLRDHLRGSQDAVELMRPLTDQREQRVVMELSGGGGVVGDSPRLASVMVNLLANANKFAPDRTTIWIEMEWTPESVTAWVEDEGPGLPALGAARDLFAPFRGSPHEEPSQRGTGLGLAIVHAVVVAHGGEVKVAEPVHGRGARIGIVLPREKVSA